MTHRARREHQWCDPLRRNNPPAKARRHSLCQGSERCGILPGIKVDIGAKNLAVILERQSQKDWTGYVSVSRSILKWRAFRQMARGNRFRRWHSQPGLASRPTRRLSRYAALCQEGGLVPVVEPEVLMAAIIHSSDPRGDGGSPTKGFAALHTQRVMLEGMILKPNMVLPGLTCTTQETADEVADATVKCLLRVVAAAVPGIAFLSAANPVNWPRPVERHECQVQGARARLPWALAFSFARAIQRPALEIWGARRPPIGGAASSVSSGPVQPGCAPRRIQCRDGNA